MYVFHTSTYYVHHSSAMHGNHINGWMSYYNWLENQHTIFCGKSEYTKQWRPNASLTPTMSAEGNWFSNTVNSVDDVLTNNQTVISGTLSYQIPHAQPEKQDISKEMEVNLLHLYAQHAMRLNVHWACLLLSQKAYPQAGNYIAHPE